MSGLHFHPLRVRDVRRDGDHAAVVTFDVPAAERAAFDFAPGQYLTVRAFVEGQDLRRSYSICAAPGEALRVGVRRVEGGAFSSWLHAALKPGDTLDVMEPQGRFGAALYGSGGTSGTEPGSAAGTSLLAAPDATPGPRHVLLVAGGSGITPILSIAKALLAAPAPTRITLLYGNRSVGSTMFKEELEDLKNRHLARLAIHTVFSREQLESPLACGRLDRERIGLFLRTLIDPRGIDHAFVCGPHAMNEEASSALHEAGVAAERIHVERFGVPPEQRTLDAGDEHAARDGDADAARITVVRDGVRREFVFLRGDPSLLDAAARAGLDVPYSCKSGVCATCRAKLLEGQVRMDRNFALDAAELEAGFVLACQSHPLTPRVTVSFDER